jgi:hypothetical protein
VDRLVVRSRCEAPTSLDFRLGGFRKRFTHGWVRSLEKGDLMDDWAPSGPKIPGPLFSLWKGIWHSSPHAEDGAPQEPDWIRADGLIFESHGGQLVEISATVLEEAGTEFHSLAFEEVARLPSPPLPCEGLRIFKHVKLQPLLCVEARPELTALRRSLVTSVLFFTDNGRCLWITLSGLPEHIKFRIADQKLLRDLWGYELRFNTEKA